jgi:hypothetical protein
MHTSKRHFLNFSYRFLFIFNLELSMPATALIFIPPNIKSSPPLVGRAVLFMFLELAITSLVASVLP